MPFCGGAQGSFVAGHTRYWQRGGAALWADRVPVCIESWQKMQVPDDLPVKSVDGRCRTVGFSHSGPLKTGNQSR